MLLVLLEKVRGRHGRPAAVRFGALACAMGIALGGCVTSTAPILGDARAILGESGQIYLYALRDGAAHDPSSATFKWNGSRYVVTSRSEKFSDFTVHAFEGRDLIVQTVPRTPRPVEFALARRLADGTYRMVAIDEGAVDDESRSRFCTKTQDAACRITTPEQLFVMARQIADGADERPSAGLAVVVPDVPKDTAPKDNSSKETPKEVPKESPKDAPKDAK
jgi:hypothetical protein